MTLEGGLLDTSDVSKLVRDMFAQRATGREPERAHRTTNVQKIPPILSEDVSDDYGREDVSNTSLNSFKSATLQSYNTQEYPLFPSFQPERSTTQRCHHDRN